jgi:SAM-dependent methyltransferase
LLPARPGRVLDAGCGSGVLANDFVGRGWQWVGLDASRGMLRAARAGGDVARERLLVESDAQALPFAARSFDAIVCVGVIDGVPDADAALSEMVRALKPGGTLIVSWANRRSPYASWSLAWRKLLAVLRREQRARRDRTTKRRLHTEREASQRMRVAGVLPRPAVYFYFNPLAPPLDQLAPRVAERCTRRLEALRTTRFAWLGAGFFVEARRPESEAQKVPSEA